jgi:hypothetical protein
MAVLMHLDAIMEKLWPYKGQLNPCFGIKTVVQLGKRDVGPVLRQPQDTCVSQPDNRVLS